MMNKFQILAAAIAALTTSASAACNHTELLHFVDLYIEAQQMGFAGYMDGASPDFTYYENNKTMDLTSGVINKILHVDHNYTIADLDLCATFTELIVTDKSKPHVIGTQIRHYPNGTGVYLMDSIVSTTGSWLFNASQTLSWTLKENWAPLPEKARSSRTVLKNAADAYLDMWSNKTAIDAVPWGTPCARLEGSAYTGNGSATDSCKPGIPTNNNQAPNSHRRYVIDEEAGVINVLCIFEHLQMAPDSHTFRLENGKVRYIHTITIAKSS